MKAISIKGKNYYPVSERLKELHNSVKEDISIETEIISDTESKVTVKAIVTIGEKVFTGHSQASWLEGMMKDVALEVAETSALGRALGFAGIGIEEGIASADEMRKVKKQTISDEDIF